MSPVRRYAAGETARIMPLAAALVWAILAGLLAATQVAAQDFTAPAHHGRIETIARDTAYLGGNRQGGPAMKDDPELLDNLRANDLELLDSIDDPDTGMQAMVLRDRQTGQEVVAFRGTWPNPREGAGDAIADADLTGDTGSVQYEAHRAKTEEWARKYPDATVTGHSLGAALAQRYMSEHPDSYGEGVVFNAPAIGRNHAHRFAQSEGTGPVTIYVGRTQRRPNDGSSVYDLVSELGGQSHLPARIVEVTDARIAGSGEDEPGLDALLGNSHTAFMLDGTDGRSLRQIPYDEFQNRRLGSWADISPLIQATQLGVFLGEIAQVSVGNLDEDMQDFLERLGDVDLPEGTVARTGEAVAGIAQGFARDGPAGPTTPMFEAGEAARQPDAHDARARDALRQKAEALSSWIEADLAAAEAFFPALRAQCDRILAVDTTDHLGKLDAVRAEAIDPALAAARQELAGIQTRVSATHKLMDAVERMGANAAKARVTACSTAATTDDDIAVIRDAALDARNHAVLTTQTGDRALAAGEEALAMSKGALPVPADIRARFTEMFGAFRQACEVANSVDEAVFVMGPATARLAKAQANLALLRSVLDAPGMPDVVTYTLTYAALQNRAGALAGQSFDSSACSAAYLRLKTDCAGRSNELPAAVEAELNAYVQAHRDVMDQRRAGLVKLRQGLDRMKGTIAQANDDAAEARACFTAAMNSQDEGAQARADALADLSTVACTPAALRSRIETLRQPEYADVPDRLAKIGKLQRTITRIRSARQKTRDAAQAISSAISAEDLARAELTLDAAFDDLARLPAELNCPRLTSALASTLTDLLEQQEKIQKQEAEKPETRQEAMKRCRDKYRAQFMGVTGTEGDYRCTYCEEGYIPLAGQCQQTFGSFEDSCKAKYRGQFLRVKGKPGSYSCEFCKEGFTPAGGRCAVQQAHADRLCNERNSGSGWRAVNIQPDNTFYCRRPNSGNNRSVTSTNRTKPKPQGQGKRYRCVVNLGDGSILGTAGDSLVTVYRDRPMPGERCTRLY